jgi:hypothetical protein
MTFDSRRGRTVLFGGFGDNGRYLPGVWEWDGRTRQRIAAEGPTPGRGTV